MSSQFNRTNPFLAAVKERYSLCKNSSQKNTQHIVLDLKGSEISYQVGDSIGIYPQNDSALVANTMQAMKGHPDDIVADRQGVQYSLQQFLKTKANLAEVNRKLFTTVCERQTNSQKRSFLISLLAEENKVLFKEYLEARYPWDFLRENEEVTFTPQEFCSLLMPLLPRLYSISSAHKVVGDEAHLTVALVNYASNGHQRFGICTHYLCHLAPLNQTEVPVYIQPHTGFTLPNPEANIIMVGPGTGVAPFRAFMQERLQQNARGKNWLFFGEWCREQHFFYQSFWNELIAVRKLKLDVAFSRDQEHKIYVQHRMLEQGKELFQWLQDGAYFYVCGDAKRMARDVEATLLHIIQTHGQLNEEASKQYLKQLRTEKRYLRDVY